MNEQYFPYVVTHDDGSQTLISIFLEDGKVTAVQVAWRSDKWATWGIPEEAERG